MNRVAWVAATFLVTFLVAGCSVEPVSSSLDRPGTEESNASDVSNDDDDDTSADGTGSTSVDRGSAGATSDDASLPAPKLLPDGAVRTVDACTAKGSANIVLGSGKITRTTRDVKGFHGVGIRGAARVILTEGSSFAVQVETDDNLQGIVTTTVSEKGNLVVEGKGSYCTTGGVTVRVTMPKVDTALVDGSGAIDATKLTAASDLTLGVQGSGAVVFRGEVAALTALIDGSGVITLSQGSAKTTTAIVKGSGVVSGKAFSPGAVKKQIDGSGVILL